MPYVLTVTEPMDGYVVGQRITDQAVIDRIMATGHSHNVKRVWVDEPAPAPAEAPKSRAKADTSAS